MISERENELLTQIGPGTPMGDLQRRYWHAFDTDLKFDVAGMRAVAHGAVASGILTSMPDMSTFYDTSLVAEALRRR